MNREELMRKFQRREILKHWNFVVDRVKTTEIGADEYRDVIKVHSTEFDAPRVLDVILNFKGDEAHMCINYIDEPSFEANLTAYRWYALEETLRYMLKSKYSDLLKALNRPDIKVDVEMQLDEKYYCVVRNGNLDHIVFCTEKPGEIVVIDNFHDWEEQYAEINCD